MYSVNESKLLARLIACAPTHQFPRNLKRVFQCFVPSSAFIFLNYRAGASPSVQFEWISAKNLRQPFRSSYLQRAYLLDPFFQLSQTNFAPGLFRLGDIAPDRFKQSTYFQSYYGRTGLCDEINFVVKLRDQSVSAVSISRNIDQGPFAKTELANLMAIAPIIAELLRQFGDNMLADRPSTQKLSLPSAANLIFEFAAANHAGPLTRRESEIAALILMGHSTPSASAFLDLSPATVKVHRRNIYRKLNISSQSELFALLHAALAGKFDFQNA